MAFLQSENHLSTGGVVEEACGGKLCIIGLDAATFSVLDHRIARGEMPELAELMQRGARAELISTIPPVTGPAWTSMTTGVNPGQHGIFDFVRWAPDGVSARLVQSGDCTVPRIWDVAGRHGRRVGVFRVPVTYPARPVNGFMVTGLLSPSPSPAVTHPPDAFEDVAEEAGAWATWADNAPDDHRRAQQILEAHRCSDRALRRMVERFRPDFLMCVSSETDTVQHALWPYCDGSVEAPDPAVNAVVSEFFRATDATIGYLKSYFGSEATYMVVSDHGAGAVEKGFRMNEFLARTGFVRLHRGRIRARRLTYKMARLVRSALLYTGLLGAARRALGGLRVRRHRPESPLSAAEPLRWAVDWERTRAIAKSRSDSGIHLNVRGRSEVGVVEPGEEYERVLAELTSALEALTDPDTGERLVSHLLRREELYDGPYTEEAADLFVGLKGGQVGVLTSVGRRLFAPFPKLGNHRMEGVLVACGPGLRQGRRPPADIRDVASTALYAAGLPVPRYMEGRVLTGLFEPRYVEQHPVSYDETPLEERRCEHDAGGLTDEEDRRQRRRLQDMGYL